MVIGYMVCSEPLKGLGTDMWCCIVLKKSVTTEAMHVREKISVEDVNEYIMVNIFWFEVE